MSQTRAQSLLEVTLSTALGYVVALLTQLAVLPLFGIVSSFSENALIALVFTVVSVIRSYIFRRVFNAIAMRRYADGSH
jgi:hypothetical protein